MVAADRAGRGGGAAGAHDGDRHRRQAEQRRGGTIAPVEAAVQPVLTTVTDTVSTLSHDVVGTIAPVEAAVQPVLDDGDRHRRHSEQ